jgi:hypothetical protein
MIAYHGAKAHSCCGDGVIFHPAISGVGGGFKTSHPRRRLARPELVVDLEPASPPLPVKVLMRGGKWLDPPEEVTP